MGKTTPVTVTGSKLAFESGREEEPAEAVASVKTHAHTYKGCEHPGLHLSGTRYPDYSSHNGRLIVHIVFNFYFSYYTLNTS